MQQLKLTWLRKKSERFTMFVRFPLEQKVGDREEE